MESHIFSVHPMHMAKKRITRPAPRPTYRRTFLQEWRDHVGLTLEQAAPQLGLSHSQLSRIERGLSPYSQPHLEDAAALYGCTTNDLISRAPDDAVELFDIWNQLNSPQREQAARVLRALKEGGK